MARAIASAGIAILSRAAASWAFTSAFAMVSTKGVLTKPGEIIVLYANGFGTTSTPVVSGSLFQFGTVSPAPAIAIGGVAATVHSAGLVAPGVYQFNIVIPSGLADGDQSIVATFDGQSTQPGTLITIHN